MVILGINSCYHEPAAALLVDGALVAAAEEERFNRRRHGKRSAVDNADALPWRAIEFCLAEAGLGLGQVEHIGYSFDPAARLRHFTSRPDAAAPAGGFGSAQGESAFYDSNLRARDKLRERMPQARLHFLSHHLCHAASAYLASPFERAGVLVVDGIAENASTWMGVGSGRELQKLDEVEDPHSLGFLWEKICEFLGFDAYDGPGKVMALGSASDAVSAQTGVDYREVFRSFVQPAGAGFRIDPEVLRYRAPGFEGLERRLGLKRAEAAGGRDRAAIAAALQETTEEMVVRLAESLYRKINRDAAAPCAALCLAGGVALNCLANARILQRTSWRRLWIQPAANDAGTALGAALLVWNQALGRAGRVRLRDAYLGPQFDDGACEAALRRAGLPFTRPQSRARAAAGLLARNRIVAWFQGRMEFGPRALGNRSILADPRDAGVRSRLNRQVKEREDFRPFAPSVAAGFAERFCPTPFARAAGQSHPTHFMKLALPVPDDQSQSFPAVVHKQRMGATARVHILESGANPPYEELLDAFGDRTGYRLLLNTSFNVREPIVASPGDACDAFLRSRLDGMMLGPFLVERS